MSKRRKTRTRGLYLNEAGYYEIDKRVSGTRIAQTTGYREGQIGEAESLLSHLVEQHRRRISYGERPPRTFEEMAAEFLKRNAQKATIKNVAGFIERMIPYFGGVYIHNIHDDCHALNSLRHDLIGKGRKAKTINAYIEILRRMLNQSEHWRDEYGVTWIDRAPKFKLLPLVDQRPPHPLQWDEQHRLISHLAGHLGKAALFAVNTGVRDWGLCNLQWSWERETDYGMAFEIKTSHPNQKERGLLICNSIAAGVVDSLRHKHKTHVFSYRGRPLTRIINSGWKLARTKAGLHDLHFHDLRHTYGYRLREAGVDFETRQDLLRHKGQSVTSHYSSADIKHLFDCAESVVERAGSKPVLRVVSR